MSPTLDVNPALRFHSTHWASFSAIGVRTFFKLLTYLGPGGKYGPQTATSRLWEREKPSTVEGEKPTAAGGGHIMLPATAAAPVVGYPRSSGGLLASPPGGGFPQSVKQCKALPGGRYPQRRIKVY